MSLSETVASFKDVFLDVPATDSVPLILPSKQIRGRISGSNAFLTGHTNGSPKVSLHDFALLEGELVY